MYKICPVPIPKFNIGDTVYIHGSSTAYLRTVANCKICNGLNKIKIKGFKDPIRCPVCDIFSSQHAIGYQLYSYIGSSTVKSIKINMCDDGKYTIDYTLDFERSRLYREYELHSSMDELNEYCRIETEKSRKKAEELYYDYESLDDKTSNKLNEYVFRK